MSTDYDDRVLEYLRLPKGEYIVRLEQDKGLEYETALKNTMLAHLASFILSNKEKIYEYFHTWK